MSYADEFTTVYQEVVDAGPQEDETKANEVAVPHVSANIKRRMRVVYRWHDGKRFDTCREGYEALADTVIEACIEEATNFLALGIIVGREEDPVVKASLRSDDWEPIFHDDGLATRVTHLTEKLVEDEALINNMRQMLRRRGDEFAEDVAMDAMPPELSHKYWDLFTMLFEAGSLVFFNVGRAMGKKETGAEEFDDIVKRILGGEGLPGADS